MDPFLIRLRRAAASARFPIGIASGLAAALAVIHGLGASLGIGGIAGLAGLSAVIYLIGLVVHASERAERRKRAIWWQGAPADADPIKHFDVRRARGRGPDGELPPFVERNATDEIVDGLRSERLVVLKGERPSGKSRLVYEVLKRRPGARALVSTRARAGAEDPWIELMEDPKGLTRWSGPTILLLRDCATRLVSGELTAELVCRWLESDPSRAIIVTFNPPDIQRIAQAESDAHGELAQLEHYGRVVALDSWLKGRELKLAKQQFPELSVIERERLPEYLSSAPTLRERFADSANGANAMGHAIVRAVADWRRAGMERPTPVEHVRAVVGCYLPRGAGGDFDAQLPWACEPVESVISLIREHEGGYVPDTIVLDMELQTYGRELPAEVWEAVLQDVRRRLEEGHARATAVDEMIALGLSATERGNSTFAENVLAEARELADGAQLDRIAQQAAPKPAAGSLGALVSTRAGDSVIHRVRETQRLADVPVADGPFANMWRQFIAWVYERVAVRTLARLGTLLLIDALSVLLGLSAGLLVRAELDGRRLAGVDSTVSRFLPIWIAVAVLALARLGLYRQDAPRARLSPMLLAALMLGGIGLIAAWTADPKLGAVPGVIMGCTVAIAVCYQLRAKYDQISRGWVRRHGLEVRTLLIGSREQTAAISTALTEISRPTTIVGYVTLEPEVQADHEHLGSVAELPTVVYGHRVGRVVIADPDMPSRQRRTLADRCHECGLVVDAVPSLTDIRAGRAELVVGQSVVLMRLAPLWPANGAFFAKRAFDLIFGSLGLLVLAVMWLPLAIAARLEGGPILVRSVRYGMGKGSFRMCRFRTTRPGAPWDTNDGAEPLSNVSRFGRFLRTRGLDELPQILNVLAGDMSIVGPRPLHPSDHNQLDDEQQLRYVARPGMTGPWLVCRNTRLSRGELAALDIAYLSHWTLFVDLEILIRTLRLAFRGRPKFPAVTDTP